MESPVNATSTKNSNIAASRNRAVNVKKRRREYRKHGLTVLKHADDTIGNRLIDRRTVTGRALEQWRTNIYC